MLQERFREFARDTGTIGQERVDAVNRQADQLINGGHGDAATVAEWKDGLNEAWADLLELIDTRTQILAASFELHKFYHDAKEILGRILDKHKKLPEELGRDQNTVETLQRMHSTFQHDIQALGTQVHTHCTHYIHYVYTLYKHYLHYLHYIYIIDTFYTLYALHSHFILYIICLYIIKTLYTLYIHISFYTYIYIYINGTFQHDIKVLGTRVCVYKYKYIRGSQPGF